MQQAVGKIIQIMQALTQIRIGTALQFRTRIILHTLNRCLSCQTCMHGLTQTTQPTLVMREHAEGFEDLAMLAGACMVRTVNQLVDALAHRIDRFFKALFFRLQIFRHELCDDDARLMQHDMTKPDTFSQRRTFNSNRTAQPKLGTRAHNGLQFARGDHLRQQHRCRLQNLDLFFRIGAARAVLHDENAQRIAAAQNRHTKEGVINLFARLWLVREGGMRLRIRQSERLRALCNQTDKAFARAHGRQMDRFAIETLCREEFEPTVCAQHVNRANLRHHIGGDMHDDLIKARLWADRLRHGFAETAQELSRSG